MNAEAGQEYSEEVHRYKNGVCKRCGLSKVAVKWFSKDRTLRYWHYHGELKDIMGDKTWLKCEVRK